MPIEYRLLRNQIEPIDICPHCRAEPFESFLRGMVQRKAKTLTGRLRPYCTIICSECKEIVGHEDPYTGEVELLNRYRYIPVDRRLINEDYSMRCTTKTSQFGLKRKQ